MAAFVSLILGKVFFLKMQEHPKQKMRCSGEDDKALDLRVPCFQTNPSADEVGLPFDQKIS